MNEDFHRRLEDLFHAARTAAPDARARLLDEACGGNLELRREVESLLAIEDESPSYLDRPAIAAGDSVASLDLSLPCSLGAYRLLREIGRGGMGRVYEGVQEGINRQVAIKLLPPTLSNVVFRRRFQAEQRILAGLEHAGIARLYDAGTTDQGLPYLVMEYIQGQSLIAYCKSRSLGLIDRLNLFTRVCDAVQFAHQHLVVHRDLKPSNILVTDEGDPKLLDFGIAKLLHEDAEPGFEATVTGLRLMTPEYASPEQIRGEPVTTASDVYSLGVVLYELLTERRPYRLTTQGAHDFEREVLERPPQRPSTAARSASPGGDGDAAGRSDWSARHAKALRGDLDNIVLKALAKQPAQRYVTAAELAADVRRHLQGLPVRARPDSLPYRARKFVGRHRWAVASGVVVTVALLAALAMTMASAAEARRERDLAARRFADVRQLANVFLFDVEQKIRDVPGTTAAREFLVNTSLGYLDRLAADAGDDPALLRELAGGYDRLGDVQGALLQANLGQSDAALSSYLKASAVRERLIRNDVAADHAFLRDSARGEQRLSQALMRIARLKEASVHSQLAIDLLARATPPAEERDLVQRERAEALTTHGYMLAINSNLDGALVLLRQAKAMYEGLPPARMAENVFGAGYTFTVFRLVQVLDELPDGQGKSEAIELLPSAIAVDRRLIAADPKSAGVRRGLARDLSKLADMLAKAGRCGEALPPFAEVLHLIKEDVTRDPRDQLARRNYNAVAGHSTRCLIALDRADEARERLEPVLADITTLLAEDAKNITLQISFCEIAVRYAEAAAKIDTRRPDPALLARARPALARAIEMLEPLVANKTLTGGDAAVLDEARTAMDAIDAGRKRRAEDGGAAQRSPSSRYSHTRAKAQCRFTVAGAMPRNSAV